MTRFLVEKSERLGDLYTTEVPMRVLLHAHEGMADLGENVARLLGGVPGLDVAGIAWESGYTCGGSGQDRSPGLKAERRKATYALAEEKKADALVSLYHGCHAQLSAAAETQGPPVVNFTDLLVRALGGEPRADLLAGWRMAGDWQALAERSMPSLERNAVSVDPEWLASLLPDMVASKEFAGGLDELVRQR